MDAHGPNPRRRHLYNTPPFTYSPRPQTFVNVGPFNASGLNYSLKKGSTFHSPSSPRSPDQDPVLSVPSLPRRSPTCHKELEDCLNPTDSRIAQLIGAVDRSLSGLGSFSSGSQDTVVPEALPVPRFLVDNPSQNDGTIDIDGCPPSASPSVHRKHHASDSGIGSSETSVHSALGHGARLKQGLRFPSLLGDQNSVTLPEIDVVMPTVDVDGSFNEGSVKTGINGNSAMAAAPGSGTPHALSEYACRQIQKHIILPIIREERLKSFHPLVGGLPYRVARKEITCLRDLEKVLLWLAPVSMDTPVQPLQLVTRLVFGFQKWSISKASFLLFCETSIQCIHTTVEYLNEADQRRPTDRPYSQGYFLDLVEQVRQYAAMLASSRARSASGASDAGEPSG